MATKNGTEREKRYKIYKVTRLPSSATLFGNIKIISRIIVTFSGVNVSLIEIYFSAVRCHHRLSISNITIFRHWIDHAMRPYKHYWSFSNPRNIRALIAKCKPYSNKRKPFFALSAMPFHSLGRPMCYIFRVCADAFDVHCSVFYALCSAFCVQCLVFSAQCFCYV